MSVELEVVKHVMGDIISRKEQEAVGIIRFAEALVFMTSVGVVFYSTTSTKKVSKEMKL